MGSEEVSAPRWYSVGPRVAEWRWLVLFAFAVNTATNSFMFMNFSTVGDVSKETFGWVDENGVALDDSATDEKLNWLYSASLLAVLPFAFPAAHLLTTHNWIMIFAMAASNCIGAWLRYVAVANKNYGVALLSSVIIGFGAAVIITACAYVPALWFPKKQRAFATSAAVMANYSGWALGTVLIPHIVHTTGPSEDSGVITPGDPSSGIKDLEWLVFVQAIIATSCPVVVLLFHREAPATDPDGDLSQESTTQHPPGAVEPTAEDGGQDRFRGNASCQELSFSCRMSVPFICQGMCHALLGGISFTIPAVQTTLFSDLDFSDSESSWTNFAFVMSGVITGLSVGKLGSSHQHLQERIIAVLYALCAVSITVVTIVAYNQDSIGKSSAYPVYIVFMGLAGAGSLGFIGVALSHACRHLPGIAHSYSAGAIEWFVQVYGAVLSQVCVTGKSSFIVLAAATWLTTTGAVVSLYGHKYALQQLERVDSPLMAPAKLDA